MGKSGCAPAQVEINGSAQYKQFGCLQTNATKKWHPSLMSEDLQQYYNALEAVCTVEGASPILQFIVSPHMRQI